MLVLAGVFTFAVTGYHTDRGAFAREYRAAFEQLDAEVLILGSSRAAASLDAETLGQELDATCYNLSFNQASLTYNYHLLKYYLHEADQKPAFVILDVSWFSLDNRRLAYKEYGSHFVFRSPLLFYEELLLGKRNQVVNGLITLGRTLERRNAPYEDFDAVKRRYPDQDSTRITYVFDPTDKGFLRTFPGGKAGMVAEEMRSFEKLVTLLEQQHIPLVLYTSPEDELFSQSQQNREEVYTYLRAAAPKATWLDYSPGGARFDKAFENWLRDSHHIYYKEAFTKIFASDFTFQVLKK